MLQYNIVMQCYIVMLYLYSRLKTRFGISLIDFSKVMDSSFTPMCETLMTILLLPLPPIDLMPRASHTVVMMFHLQSFELFSVLKYLHSVEYAGTGSHDGILAAAAQAPLAQHLHR